MKSEIICKVDKIGAPFVVVFSLTELEGATFPTMEGINGEV